MSARRLLPFLVLLVLLAAGCRTGKDDGGVNVIEGGGEEEPATWDLVLTLAEPVVTAGDSVAYGLVMVSSAGETVEVVGDLQSDLQDDFFRTDEEATFTVAGTHTLTATAAWEDQVYTATATLEVQPGPVAVLDLALSDLAFAAGESITYTVAGWDAWGNEADASGAAVSVDSDELTVGGGTISGTLPGTYTATATDGDAADSEVFVVVPGDPASVTLTLSDTDLEVYETTHATVEVLDAWGNPTDDPWTITAYGTGLTAVSYANITFYEEGEYYVRVDVDGTELYDEVGPLLIDSTGPDLVIDTPDRGDWIEGDSGAVSGSVSDDWTGVASLTVNGDAATVNPDGTFNYGIDYDFGTNIIETEAVDGDGNSTTDTRAVLAGDFLEYGAWAPSGLLVRLHEGPGGIDVLEDMGSDLVAATDLDALIPSPAYSAEQESCYDVLWWEVCVTWYSIDLYVTNPSIGGTSLDLDPTASGTLDATFTVTDVSLNWSADGTLAFIDYSGSGTITVDSLDVAMSLVPYVDNGDIKVDVQSVDVTTSGFDFDWDSWLYDIIDFFGVPVDDWIAGYVEDALESTVSDEVPALVEDSLADLEIAQSFDVGDVTCDFDAVPDTIAVDDTGITLALETAFTARSWTLPREGLGSLYYGYSGPTWTGSPGMVLGVNDDFLNQVFYALWGAGLLSYETSGEELGLSVDDLSLIFPDLTELNIVVDPLLPPVVVPGTGTDPLDFQLGDLHLVLYNGPAEAGYEMLEVYVSAVAGMTISATADNTLTASLGDMDLYFDVVVPEANTVGAEDTEALLGALVPMLLPSLTDALGEIAIPDISGFTISGITVDTAGPEDGFITLGGDLTAM